MSEFSPTKWIERVRQNDQQAARELVEHLYPLVIRIVRSHLPRRMSDEDLAQEVFLKLFSRLDQYQERAGVPFDHWLARLTVRTCLDHLRAERRRPEHRWSDLTDEERRCLDDLRLQHEAAPEVSPTAAREVVTRLLKELSPADRLVITLLDLEQRTVREISQITGWTSTLVKVRAFRARRKLRSIATALQLEPTYEPIRS
jgi:RNA polymerase sigma-70 factor, ECF subfamily